ncbi:LGFP repeat-containing protein [Nocardia blacklockiae]|uniref:LGFP repeat-containing protein n=1 Tax=Nocardia blacklockiae TaxID=480036 RepID=UPI00189454EE|nr:esterase [Nocardia blacklockiae]MBF6171162.1 esterase [Nocardia blacklockiae]
MHHFARRSAACTMTIAAAALLFTGCSNDDDNNDSSSSASATTSLSAATTTPGSSSEHETGTQSGAATETKIATQNGEFAVAGPVLAKYTEMGGPTGTLGEPTGAAVSGPDGGSCQEFTAGLICSSEKTGSHVVWGDIRQEWENSGGVNSKLGYPTTDEKDIAGGKESDFTGGTISWNASDRKTTVTEK